MKVVLGIAASAVAALTQASPGDPAAGSPWPVAEAKALHDGVIQSIRNGQGLRTAYDAALRQPRAGGLEIAQGVEGYCYLVGVRAQQQSPGSTLRVDASDAAGAAFHRALEKGRTSCASIQPFEIDPAPSHHRHQEGLAGSPDPLFTLRARLQRPSTATERRTLTKRVLDAGAPLNLSLMTLLLMHDLPGQTVFVFDGRRWPVVSADGQERLQGRSDQLVAALALARCELGEPCGPDSPNAQQHCLQRPVDCAQPSYPDMVRAMLGSAGYVDLEIGLQGLEPIKNRLVQAIRQREVAAFLDDRRPAAAPQAASAPR